VPSGYLTAVASRVQIASVLAVIGGVLAIGWWGCAPREPRYADRPLSAWLADLDLANPHSPESATSAIRALGTNSFPCLTKMLRERDPPWKRAAMWLNDSQSLVRFPVTPARVIRNRAVQGYVALGLQAVGKVPELVGLMESEKSAEVRAAVAAALGGLGRGASAAIPALLKATQDPNKELRDSALLALANIRMWNPTEGPVMR
jgi:HEAT repeat protein